MKLTVLIEPDRECLDLRWQFPGQTHEHSFYLAAPELTPVRYPHIVGDCGKLASFWGDKLVVMESPGNFVTSQSGEHTARADVIHCNTFKLLEVLRKLHARQVPRTVLDTKRLVNHSEFPQLTISQIRQHPNLFNRELLGKTLQRFHQGLRAGRRSFRDLLNDLSRILTYARVHAQGDEFYFDGRQLTNGCGFNGGIILHRDDYGIHT